MFVFDDNKPFIVLPICYHPTTVLALDDERQFLDTLELEISDHVPLLCFDNPDAALKYIYKKVEHSRYRLQRVYILAEKMIQKIVDLQECWKRPCKTFYILAPKTCTRLSIQ